MNQSIELSDVIRQLRAELESAMQAGEGERLRFEPGPLELELSVALEKATDGGGKVRFWVLDAGASHQRSSTVTQRIKLVLDPRQGDNPGQRPLISGQALDAER
jgi:hypothetical protein